MKFNFKLKKKEDYLQKRIDELEETSYTSYGGLSDEELKELERLHKIKRKSRKNIDPKVLSAAITAIGSIVAAGITAAGLVYRVKMITRYEDNDEVVTSAAGRER